MCGLAGVGYFKTSKQPIKSYKARNVISQFLISELLVESLPRGEHATGIGLVGDDNKLAYVKAGWASPVFFEYSDPNGDDVKKLFEWWNKRTVNFAMGHVRKRTVGAEWNNDNNHPVHRDNILMVHNGTVTNHEEIFKSIKDKVQPSKGECDSEAIAAWLEAHYNTTQFTKESIQAWAKELDGAFTTFTQNRLYPNILAITRADRDLSLLYSQKHNLFIAITFERFVEPVLAIYNRFAVRNSNGKLPKIHMSDFQKLTVKENTGIVLDFNEVPGDSFKEYVEERAFKIEPMKSSTSSQPWTGNSSCNTGRQMGPGPNNIGGSKTSGVGQPSKYGKHDSRSACAIVGASKVTFPTKQVAKKEHMTSKDKKVNHPIVEAIDNSIDYVEEDEWTTHLEKVAQTCASELKEGDYKDILIDAGFEKDIPSTVEDMSVVIDLAFKAGATRGADFEYERWAPHRNSLEEEIARLMNIAAESGGARALRVMVLALLKAGASGEVPRDKILEYLHRATDIEESDITNCFTAKELETLTPDKD